MKIIEIPHEHTLLQLDSIEILALWRALGRASDTMDKESFVAHFHMTPDRASELGRKLAEALNIARKNLPQD